MLLIKLLGHEVTKKIEMGDYVLLINKEYGKDCYYYNIYLSPDRLLDDKQMVESSRWLFDDEGQEGVLWKTEEECSKYGVDMVNYIMKYS